VHALGIESERHGHYDPQGLIGVGSNVVRNIQKGENISGDLFDGVAIVAGDGAIGASMVNPKPVVKTTTTVCYLLLVLYPKESHLYFSSRFIVSKARVSGRLTEKEGQELSRPATMHVSSPTRNMSIQRTLNSKKKSPRGKEFRKPNTLNHLVRTHLISSRQEQYTQTI